MFRGAKGPRRPSADNTTVDANMTKAGYGPGATLMGGATAAWTRSFDMSQYVSKRAPDATVPQRGSNDDLLENIDQELLNTGMDEAAWGASWYVGRATNSAVMQALDGLADGAFVVRDSSSQPGSFALSYRCGGETHHALIHSHGRAGKLQLAKCPEEFDSLTVLVERFSQHYQPDADGAHLLAQLNIDVAVPLRADLAETDSMDSGSGAVLNKLDADGNIVAVSAQTGKEVSNAPPLPPRKAKPQMAGADVGDPGSPVVTMKAGVMLCPHCSSKQSIKNLICSSCNGRLDEKGADEDPSISRNRRASSTRAYTRVMGKSKPQPQPDDRENSPASSDGRQPTQLDVIVAPPEQSLSSILLSGRKHRRGRGSLGMRISFDENNIVDSRRESLLVRGIISRVDEAFDDLGLYFASDFTLKSQAADKLKGLHRGAFLVYDSPDAYDEMIVTYVDKRGGAQHATLAHSLIGMYIVFPTDTASKKATAGPHFERLSHLMLHYASEEADPPSVFALTEEQREILTGEDLEDEDSPQPSADYAPSPLIPAPVAPPQTAAAATEQAGTKNIQEDQQPAWLKPDLSRAEAVACIEFEPNGSFVIRRNQDEKDSYVMSYVLNGGLHHHGIEVKKVGDSDESIRLTDSKLAFGSLHELVEYYATPEGGEAGDLKCRLRLKRGTGAAPVPAAALAQLPPPVMEDPSVAATASALRAERPQWLQTSLPKAQALQILVNRDDGAFVVRSSESRPDCYVLSYKFRNQVHHELIKVRSTPTGTAFFLSSAPNATFGSLQELLTHYEQPQPPLKYPLQPALMAGARNRRSTRRLHHNRLGSRASQSSQSAQSAPASGDVEMEEVEYAAPVRASSSRSRPGSGRRFFKKQSSKTSLNGGGGGGSGPALTGPPPPMVRSSSRHNVGRAGERLDQRAALSNWCCLNLSREEAMARLPQKEGAFIVRRSDDNFGTLSMIANGKTFHAQIEDTTQGVHLKKSSVFQPNLSALIAYYKISSQTDLPRALLSW